MSIESTPSPGVAMEDDPVACHTLASVKASNDAKLETRIGQTLRIGVYASSCCLAGGLVVNLLTAYDTTAQWLMVAGLMMLMATPVARVAATVVEYAVSGDWPFFVLTSIVLLELAAGVIAALVLHRRF